MRGPLSAAQLGHEDRGHRVEPALRQAPPLAQAARQDSLLLGSVLALQMQHASPRTVARTCDR